MISRSLLPVLVLSLAFPGTAFGQDLVIRKEGITDAEFDMQGNIYLSTQTGSIIKLDSSFRELASYTAEKIIPISSIDVSNRFRIFGFYKNNQSFILLDQNLRILNDHAIDSRMVGNGVAACYASDQTIWIFDDLDFSLKKLNPSLNQIVINVRLSLLVGAKQYQIIQMEEYQNRIYVNNSTDGIYVFNKFGNFLKKIDISTPQLFKIYKAKLYFVDQSAIKAIDLYTNEMEMISEIKKTENILAILVYDHQIFAVYPDSVYRL
jgi:hypothetical protein